MSNVSGVGSTSGAGYVSGGGIDASGMSPDGILAYCEFQLNGLGNQTDQLIQQQETQLSQQQAIESVQTTLESFGTNGPSSASQMQTCVAAFQQAIKNLPPNDPVAAQLSNQMATMVKQYGYVAPGLTDSQQQQLNLDEANPLENVAMEFVDPAQDAATLTDIQANGQLSTKPSDNGGMWQSTTDDLGNLASNIKANANIQMLSLQNLTSQMQQAVEQSTQLMSSEDSTLLDQAKAIGM
jgi:hypothetical protein